MKELLNKNEEQLQETVLITGATGFLGEYLVRRLIKKYRVLALGRNQKRGKYLESLGAVFCPGDFTDESCADYFQGAQYVIHGGALSTVWGRWEDFYKTNVEGTAKVARWCYECGVKRLVYISSPSIYTQKTDRLQIREGEAPKENDLNCYIRSKLMAEREIARWAERGLETVILRPRGLIGIGDTSLVPRLLRANGRIGIPLFRNGDNMVDLTSVENVAQACELAMTAAGAAGETFNITNGEPVAFREILEQFLKAIGEKPRYRKLPFGLVYTLAGWLEKCWRLFALAGEPPLTRYTVCTLGFAQTMDIRRAREILGYAPEKTLEQSVREYGIWWKEQFRKRQGTWAPTEVQRREAVKTGKEETSGEVDRAVIYHCGRCTNNLKLIYRSSPWEKREFPARAVWIHHRRLGNILFDTGYSRQIFQGGILQKLYQMVNPVCLEAGQTIREQLVRDGIAPESISTIILSHAHPDHIGGLTQFTDYELVALEEVWEALQHPKLSNLTFPGMLPKKDTLKSWRRPLPLMSGEHFLCDYFEQVFDLFGDGSVMGIRLDGHCKGQMGIFIGDLQLFLGADACWGRDLISATSRMRLPARWIQHDFSAYRDSLRQICRLKREHREIRFVFTHDRECGL